MDFKEILQEYISELIIKKKINFIDNDDLIFTIEEISDMVVEYINQLIINNNK